MRNDSRLPRVLHTLLHLADRERPATSEQIAKMLGTNSSVVRRTMAGLRHAGILKSVKGHGGGWSLNKQLEQVSLLDVYEALGAPQLFAIGVEERGSHCLLERAANEATQNALATASASFRHELSQVTIDQLSRDFMDRFGGKPGRVKVNKP